MNLIPLLLYVVAFLSAFFARSLFMSFSNALLDNMVILGIGIQGIWAWYKYCFTPQTTANELGREVSSIHRETGYIYLSFGLVGVAAYYFQILIPGLVLAFSLFSFSQAYVHLINIKNESKHQVGLRVVKFWTDILIPVTLLAIFWQVYGFLFTP